MSYSAEFACKDEDASFEQHAGIDLQQVPHIDCHNQLCQVPLVHPQTCISLNRQCILYKTHPLCGILLDINSLRLTFSGMEGRLLGSGAMKYGTW